MSIVVCPAPIAQQRWTKGVERYGRESIYSPTTHAAIARGLAIVSGDIRTVHHVRGAALGVTLPAAMRAHLRVQAQDKLQFLPIDEDSVLVRRIDSATLRPLERIAVDLAAEIRAAALPETALQHNELRCGQCRKPFCWPNKGKQFCPVCVYQRRRAAQRAYWHRKGKLTPSYQMRLKGTGPQSAEGLIQRGGVFLKRGIRRAR
ncbi:MAG: hypothetical protein DMG57_38120 [Acidobacteria bacterium]|nr:MAG: hypothetical protein DMG57_38120 [Acidobacteriota bacterium]